MGYYFFFDDVSVLFDFSKVFIEILMLNYSFNYKVWKLECWVFCGVDVEENNNDLK